MLKRKILSALLLVFTIGAVKAQDANILIGLNGPSYGVKIKNNFPGETRGFARAFMLSNQDASVDFFGFGVNGIVTNGISTPTYGYIGQNYTTPMMSFLPNGNVGIGTITPSYRFTIQKNSSAPAIMIGGGNSGSPRLQVYGLDADPNAWMGLGTDMGGGPYEHSVYFPKGTTTLPGKFTIGDYDGQVYTTRMTILQNGYVGIGTVTPNEKLSVNGKIRAQEIKVETANWPDYVFKKDYQLPTLEETENQIKLNGHLPGIPSAAEVKANGIEVGEMNAKLLRKIEELTLHLILKDKELAKERSINKDQEERLSKLESFITERK